MNDLSRDAVVRLWDDHGAALVLYAQQLCDTPEDIVQEAFLLLVRQGGVLENPVGWLYRVVRNRALNAARTSDRRARREAEIAAHADGWFEAASDDKFDAAEATVALQSLSMDQREVVVARLWGGHSFEQVSQLTGMSLSTVYRCYQRGIAALREMLGTPCRGKKN